MRLNLDLTWLNLDLTWLLTGCVTLRETLSFSGLCFPA